MSTLSYDGETVRAGLGSYCLRSICADMFGIPVSEEALTVPAGSMLTFEYAGKKLDSISAAAEPIRRGDHIEKFAGGSFLMADEGTKARETTRIKARHYGNRARIPAKLPVGEYALTVSVQLPRGDALYGFRVVVE